MPDRKYNQDGMNNSVNVLVTGGAGFIGRHLVESLLEKDHSVTIFDNFSNSTMESLSHLIRAGANVVRGDITRSEEISDAAVNQDAVIHLAAKISVSESVQNPLETFRVNVDGTRNVLAACEKNNIKKLIVSSSAAVYGEGVSGVGVAEDEPLQPISPYGKSKAEMEQEIKSASGGDQRCVILRFFNIYGIGQTDEYSGVITKFLKRIKEGRNLEIFGDGMQKRDFISIHDVIYSINMALSHEKSGTYNIASGDAITIKELAERMISLSGKDLKITHSDAKSDEISSSQASINLAERDLQFVPKTTLDEGIAALIQARYE